MPCTATCGSGARIGTARKTNVASLAIRALAFSGLPQESACSRSYDRSEFLFGSSTNEDFRSVVVFVGCDIGRFG